MWVLRFLFSERCPCPHKTSEDYGYAPTILEQVMEVNEQQRVIFTERILSYYSNDVKGKTFAMWGLAFKPNTDDMREAPSIHIVNTLTGRGATCRVYDPKAHEVAEQIFAGNGNVLFGKNQYDVLDGADALILVTEWLSFREPDFERVKSLLKVPVIFDGRNSIILKPCRALDLSIIA